MSIAATVAALASRLIGDLAPADQVVVRRCAVRLVRAAESGDPLVLARAERRVDRELAQHCRRRLRLVAGGRA